jgi:hypothetical protein
MLSNVVLSEEKQSRPMKKAKSWPRKEKPQPDGWLPNAHNSASPDQDQAHRAAVRPGIQPMLWGNASNSIGRNISTNQKKIF